MSLGLEEKISQVLLAIIEEYIKTAQPVGSLDLAEKYGMNLSSATIRNYMNDLEDEGYLYQPHISAGRIPTEAAYQFYLENRVAAYVLSKNIKSRIQNLMVQWQGRGLAYDRQIFLKSVAKMLAEISKDLVVVEFRPNDVYYTGLTYLFEQPEFGESDIVISIGRFIDHVEEMINRLRGQCFDEVKAFIGKNNPVNRQFSIILGRYNFKDRKTEGVFGMVGPLRMPYAKNIALMRLVQNQLSQIA